MLASILILALAAAPAPCSLSDGTLPPSSTLADQFTCYKNAGIKVSIPGSVLVHGGLSREGCILGVGADRLEVGECGPFPRTKFTIQFSSVRAVVDVPNERYVILELEPTGQITRRIHQPLPRPTPQPAPAAEPAQSLDMWRAGQAKP
jgi:hypothetical protein